MLALPAWTTTSAAARNARTGFRRLRAHAHEPLNWFRCPPRKRDSNATDLKLMTAEDSACEAPETSTRHASSTTACGRAILVALLLPIISPHHV